MPERKFKTKEKIKTTEIQGADSYVEMLTPTYQDLEAVLNRNGDSESPKSQMEISKALLDRLVVGWNWVDDNGDPLPQPGEDPNVIKSLPIQETLFLIDQVKIDGINQKKSPRK